MCNINSMYIVPYVSVDLLEVDSVSQVVSYNYSLVIVICIVIMC